MLRHRFPRHALGAVLIISTALTSLPVQANDLIIPAEPALTTGQQFRDDYDIFSNAADLDTAYEGFTLNGKIGTALNSGRVTVGANYAFDFEAAVGGFSNVGAILAGHGGVRFQSAVGWAKNTGTIQGGTGEGMSFASVTTFDNYGTISSISSDGVAVSGTAGTFTNHAGGSITSDSGKAIDFDGAVTTFVNNGTVESGYKAIDLDSPTGSFTNTGTIKSGTGWAIDAQSNSIGTFTNSGTISSSGDGALLAGAIGSFTNSGTISGFTTGVEIARAGTFFNTGRIETTIGPALMVDESVTLDNRGTITGTYGILLSGNGGSGSTIVNSGTIEGTGGTAICSCGTVNDILRLRTGSRILGTVDLGAGTDEIDVSQYGGNTILTVKGIETVTRGPRLVNAQLDGSGDGTLSIVDATAITQSGSAVMGEVAGAIGGEIAGALGGAAGGTAPAAPMGYAPARPQGAAEAATDELAGGTKPTGPQVWGKVFGGVVGKTNEYGAVLGGIVAGSHVAVDSTTRLGGVVSVSGSRFVTAGNSQVVTSTIGSLGLYGSTDLGSLTISYSMLGGVAANHSDRTITALVNETARADFSSWYWSPEIAVSIPVPLLDGVETDAGFKLRYIGGGVGGYTETGSSQNLTVGASSLNLLDARVELTARTTVASNDFGDVILSGTGGLLALHNFGASVSVAGFPLATTAAGTALGLYGDVTLEAPIGPSARASASAGMELRTDSVSSASANLGLSASF